MFSEEQYKKNMRLEKKYVKVLSMFNRRIPDIECSTAHDEGTHCRFSDKMSENVKKWRLGYAAASTVPNDILNKKYCIAGNTRLPANYAVGVLNDTRVRVIALDDCSGGGIAVFAAVDCIGISSYFVEKIRSTLKLFCMSHCVSSVNISSTHVHSAVDTMGIWGPIVGVIRNNRKVLKRNKGTLKQSLDLSYMDFLISTVCTAIKNAVEDMTDGRLFSAFMGKNTISHITSDNYDNITAKDSGIAPFVWDRRAPYDCSCALLRLRFEPSDKTKKPTVLVNFAAHPYITALKTKDKGNGDEISGDFVYHLNAAFEKAGYNSVFINGAVAAVYPKRLYSDVLNLERQAFAVGNELARAALAMTESSEEIEKSAFLSPESWEKELACEGVTAASEYRRWLEHRGNKIITEEELAPEIKISTYSGHFTVDNPVYLALGKLHIGIFNFSCKNGSYSAATGTSLVKLGDSVNIALVPGELEPSLISGTFSVKAEYSFSGKAFPDKCLSEIAGDNNLFVFGLTNDEAGYIIPDNDFSFLFLGTKQYKRFGNHYLELFSFGRHAASELTGMFKKAVEAVK